MRFLPISWFYGLVLTGLALILTTTVYADEICSGEMAIPVNAVETSLQAMLVKAPEQGKFKVTVNMDENGVPFQHRITYEVNNKVIFKKNINRTSLDEPGANFDIKPVAQDRALYFVVNSGGNNPSMNCYYVFVPEASTIRKISLNKQFNWAYTEDLDKDGNPEIIIAKSPDWIDSCDGRLCEACIPYWFQILHVDMLTGELRDDSSQYPDFYANQANTLKDTFKDLQNPPAEVTGGPSGLLPPACTRGFEDLISRAEKTGAGQSANSTPASQPPIISSSGITTNCTTSLNSVEKQMVIDAQPYAELSKAIYDCSDDNCFKAQNPASSVWKVLEADDEDNGVTITSKKVFVQVGNRVQEMNENDLKILAQEAKQGNVSLQNSGNGIQFTGFHAALYQDTKNKRLTIVFEGTTATSLDDWFNNVGQIEFVPPQYQRALQFADKVIKKYCNGDSSCGNKIVVTGHSLGGGLAQYVALSRGMKAFLFNPAGLWGPTWDTIAAETKFIDAKIISFSGVGYHGTKKWFISDVVSQTGTLYGSQVFIPVELPIYSGGSSITSEIIAEAVSIHGMENLLTGMIEFASATDCSASGQTLANLKLDGDWHNTVMGDSFVISDREGKATDDNDIWGTKIGDVVLTITRTSGCIFKGRYRERYGSWLDVVGWINPRGELAVSHVKDPEAILYDVEKGGLLFCQKSPDEGITKEGDEYLRSLENTKRVDLFKRK